MKDFDLPPHLGDAQREQQLQAEVPLELPAEQAVIPPEPEEQDDVRPADPFLRRS